MVRKRNLAAEVDWAAYFTAIRSVCPWSLPAFLKGQIEIVQYKGYKIPLDEPLQARVYVCAMSARELRRLATKWENIDLDCEWLWSHPQYKNNSAPVPCLIQQNRQYLAELRTK